MKKLYLIIGKRKAGTTFLYNSIEGVWKPSTKDQSWDVLERQIEEFANDEDECVGLIAKADASLQFDKLTEIFKVYNNSYFKISIIYIDRDYEERRLSFIAHERKSNIGSLGLQQANKRFLSEEAIYSEAESKFQELGVDICALNYKNIIKEDFKAPFNLQFNRTQRVLNSKTQSLPFFYFIDRLVSTDIYRRLKYTPVLVKAREFYYRFLSNTKRSNSFVKVLFLAPLSGPIDGQRKLTQIYFNNSNYSVKGIDYNYHRSAFAPLILAFQFVKSLVTCVFAKPDIVYVTLSRTNFGMMRDFLLFSPFRYLRGIWVVAHIHGSDFESHFLLDSKFKKFKKLYLASISSFIFIHESLVPVDNWTYLPTSKVVRNPLPFGEASTGAVSAISKDLSLPTSKPVIGFISAFIPGKGLETFIEIVEARTDLGDYQVAGGAHNKFPEYGEKMQQILSNNTDISYLGFLENPKVFYEQCDVVLFPTRYSSEAVPGVVLESLVSGCVVFLPRSENLEKVFANSPIQWFDDVLDCVNKLDYMVGTNRIEELGKAGQLWVANSFPCENKWVRDLDSHILDVAVRDIH